MPTFNKKTVKSAVISPVQPAGVTDSTKRVIVVFDDDSQVVVTTQSLEGRANALTNQITEATANKTELETLSTYIKSTLSLS